MLACNIFVLFVVFVLTFILSRGKLRSPQRSKRRFHTNNLKFPNNNTHNKRTMKTSFIHSVMDLENSRWAEAVRNAEVMNNLTPMATDWLNKHTSHSELAQRVKNALSILTSDRRSELLTPRNIILLASGILYVISPVDAVPDFIPFAGLADDLGVIALVLKYILASVNNIHPKSESDAEATEQADK